MSARASRLRGLGPSVAKKAAWGSQDVRKNPSLYRIFRRWLDHDRKADGNRRRDPRSQNQTPSARGRRQVSGRTSRLGGSSGLVRITANLETIDPANFGDVLFKTPSRLVVAVLELILQIVGRRAAASRPNECGEIFVTFSIGLKPGVDRMLLWHTSDLPKR